MTPKLNMWIIDNKNIFFTIAGILVAACVGLAVTFGLPLGIDFTGGSIIEVAYEGERPNIETAEESVAELGLSSFSVRPSGDDQFIIRTTFLEEAQRQELLAALEADTDGEVSEERFSSVGPVIGSELASKALTAIGIVIFGIITFIAFAFRKVSKPVSSYKYGLVAIAALIHDILLPIGVFAVIASITGAQIDVLFVMALLTILGYSVNDTIVVMDRVRENLQLNEEYEHGASFDKVVGQSLEDTFVRSINTSLTTVIVLFSLYWIGGESTELFALMLLVGAVAGTYSSIFLASPLLVKVKEWQDAKESA